jgi:outer membrane protein
LKWMAAPRLALLLACRLCVPAQDLRTLTLEQAEQMSVNNPRIESAAMGAKAAGTAVPQVRSALQPALTANLTTVGADQGTSIAAGTLQTSGLASRAATGLGFSQLITDFGRTSNLADSARLRASAQDRNVAAIRAQVLLQVDQAYYAVLSSEAVLNVAKASLEMQRLTLRRVQALSASDFKSTLDVSFAEVSVSDAELALFQAENATMSSRALLNAAIGLSTDFQFQVADVPLPGQAPPDAESLVEEALKNRPEVSMAKLNQSAAERLAEAERRLRYPAISIVGAVGAIPFHQTNLPNQYSAAGLNISIPFLNGGLFAARREEADFRSRASGKDAEALIVQVAGNVRVAWLEARNSWRRIDVTARLVDQTSTALRLAKARYDIGLSGILELTQAQLLLTSAQISAATAKYDYLTRVANLHYAIGALR